MKFETIDRFPGYRFCDDGSIWSAWQPAGMGYGMKIGSNWRKLKPSWTGGYLNVRLSCTGVGIKKIAVHVAIAEAFLGAKPDPTMDCCHNDGDRSNCTLNNLRYDTKKGNCADKVRHGRMYGGERHHDAKLLVGDVLAIRAAYGNRPVTVIAREYGISVRNAYHIIGRKTWKNVHAP